MMPSATLLRTLGSLPALASVCLAGEFQWQTATPESQGVSREKLQAIQATLAAKKTRAFLVVRNDRIVHEWYAPGQSVTNRQGTASLAKALIGGMSLAVAVEDRKISLDDTAAKFVPQWLADSRKSRITIRHLGSHTSGLDDAEEEGKPHEQLTGWKGEFWKRLGSPRDPFTLSRDDVPLLFSPGQKLQYSNPGIAMMTYCVTAALRDTARPDIRSVLRERVFRPIGISDDEWSAGYEQTFAVEGLSLVCSWGGAAFTPRATARIGRLVLREGDWAVRTIFRPEVVQQITSDAGLPGNCGMGWWSNGGARYSKLPKDAVWGAGAGDQLLLVIPSLDLIMVRNGDTLAPGPGEPPVRQDDVFTRYHDYRAHILFEPLVEAVINRGAKTASSPYPPSPVIAEVRWAPKETIIRRAKGSDNWPLTWADDDLLYTAYGDGNGFEPFVPEKLSMGLATITGTPPGFTGTNLRSATAESKGQGADGRKASGLLCVEGTLYLWARNVTNSKLAWSSDHGQTWTWAEWKFTNSFGCPAFLNFGWNYAGARDEFAYAYSPDADSAYQCADQLVLARAPKTRLRHRDAWECFAGFDASGRPRWTSDLGERRGVFTHSGQCYRTSVTWNTALHRYLLVQPVPNAASHNSSGQIDTRFSGGLAIYDAPEPWGPWTTAYFSEQWDVGPGEFASFPTKWMSADGRTMHLVFSGDDSFAVRQAMLVLR
jgi:CubicO group peptidase (beta-lactamase class C family)